MTPNEGSDVKHESGEAAGQRHQESLQGDIVDAVEKIEEVVREFSGEIHELRSIFSGPIPPPNILRDYNQAVPGLGDRIVTMAEKEGDHRRYLEKTSLEGELRLNNKIVDYYAAEVHRGQTFAVAIGFFAILAGTVAALMGAQIAGGFIGAGGVIGLVAVFIHGRKNPFSTDSDETSPTKTDKAPQE
jgi:uncharacterized membrane protein